MKSSLMGLRVFLKREITETYLPQHWKDALHTSSCCRTDAFIKHVFENLLISKFELFKICAKQYYNVKTMSNKILLRY